MFEHERRDWALPKAKGVSLKGLPSGLPSAPVKLRSKDRPDSAIDLVAGFFAVKQHPSDLTLAPVVGWSVTDPPPEKPVRISNTRASS
jgi:hypothetical protein